VEEEEEEEEGERKQEVKESSVGPSTGSAALTM